MLRAFSLLLFVPGGLGFVVLRPGYNQEDGSSFEEGMLKLLRTLPKVLKYLPSDKAKDARNFMMSFQVQHHCAMDRI